MNKPEMKKFGTMLLKTDMQRNLIKLQEFIQTVISLQPQSLLLFNNRLVIDIWLNLDFLLNISSVYDKL